MKLPYLDPTSHKSVCSKCGHKTFVNYLGIDDQPIAEGVFGRCDRQDHCAYFQYPYDYLRQLKERTKLPAKKRRTTASSRRRLPHSSPQPQPIPAIATPQPKPAKAFTAPEPAKASPLCRIHQPVALRQAPLFSPPDSIAEYDMSRTLGDYQHNSLAIFLHRIFDKIIDPGSVDFVLKRYCVGTSYESVIYWQVDQQKRIRTGKRIVYDAATGKRSHQPGSTGWMHRKGHRLEQAYFGAHLLANIQPDLNAHNAFRESVGLPPLIPTIWLFESEKAALIAALFLSWGGIKPYNIIPMATGGADLFNPSAEALANPYHRLHDLKGKRLVIFPDEGMYQKWLEKALRLPSDFTATLAVSNILEGDIPLKCEVNSGDGLDDIFLRYIADGRINEIFDLPLY